MLKISRTSWHYRMWKLVHQHSEPRNLCRYFWANVFTIVIPTVICSFALAGLTALLWLIWSNPIESALTVGAIGLAAVLITLTVLLVKDQARRSRMRPVVIKPHKKPKPPGVLRAYLVARKKKMCPLIEVVD